MVGTALVLAASIATIKYEVTTQDRVRSEEIARSTAARICAAVQGVFADAFANVNTARDGMMALQDNGLTDPRAYDTMLKELIASGGQAYGAWLVWDGPDAPLDETGASRRDTQGRFATYWHQNGMEMLRDTLPAEILASDLYTVPRKEGTPYLLEPHAIDAINGDATLVTSFSMPLERDGRVVGALAVDLKLDAISSALADIALPKGASITVVSDGGMVAMSNATRGDGKPLSAVDPAMARLLAKARIGDGSRLDLGVDAGNGILTSWSAIRFAGVKNPWYLIMKVPQASLLSGTWSERALPFLVSGVALMAILVLVLATMNVLISTPLRRLSVVINGLGQGSFDFKVAGTERSDEVGDIARAVLRLQDSGLQIARLHEANGESEYQRQVSRRAELDGISTRFSRSVETLLAAACDIASTVEVESRKVSATAVSAVERLGDVSQVSDAARSSMMAVAEAASSMLTTIGSVGDRTRQSKIAAERVERHTASTELSIAELRRTISSIDGVASMIRNVATQINLIALNATIEAARAGDAGRSFAVVAQEIKVLAMQTAKATDEIGGHIAAVHRASGLADSEVSEMKDAFAAMHEISSDIATALAIQVAETNGIAGLVDEAIGGGDAVARHTRELIDSSRQVDAAAGVVLVQSGALNRQINGVNEEVRNFLSFLATA